MTDKRQIIEKAQERLKDSKLHNMAMLAWRVVTEQIDAKATKARPKPKVYEVYHETEVARGAFLAAIVEGKTAEDAKFAALDRVKIGYVRNTAGRFLRWAADPVLLKPAHIPRAEPLTRY